MPVSVAKVEVKLFPVLPAVALFGLTVIVPEPELLLASVNVFCAVKPEADCALGFPAIEVIDQQGLNLLCHVYATPCA